VTSRSNESSYPTRPRYFAHRYCRLLTKTCACQELGHIAFCLCVTVALQEDSKRYKGPVTYFNEQLMPLIGVRKWDALDQARKRAMEHGWLRYESGGRRSPGRYWVTIPDGLEDLDDAPCDESRYPSNGDNDGDLEHPSSPPSSPANGYKPGDKPGYKPGDKLGDDGGEPSYLNPIPIPSPNPKELPSEVCSEQSLATDSKPSGDERGIPSEYTFPTKGKAGASWTLPVAQLAEYREAYLGLDVDTELRKARQWCRSNPTRRKTARGMLTFLTNWLNRATDCNRGSPATRLAPFDELDVSFTLPGET
jgi:hypothetical protein